MFPEPREQAKAIGVYGFVASAGGSIGLLAGGVLTEAINWHWIFFVNLPVGIATAALALRLVDGRAGSASRPAPTSRAPLLLTGGLMLGVYTHPRRRATRLDLGPDAGARRRLDRPGRRLRRPPGAHREPADAAAAVRARATSPGANLVQGLLVVGMFAMFFLGALYMQQILGYDAARGRPRVPARDDRHGRAVGGLLRRGSSCASARNVAGPEPRADRRRACCCSPARRSTANYWTDLLPVDDPRRPGRRPRLPGADDARDVRRHARGRRASPRAWSTRAPRWAARSAWPCWRRSPPSAPARWPPPASRCPPR